MTDSYSTIAEFTTEGQARIAYYHKLYCKAEVSYEICQKILKDSLEHLINQNGNFDKLVGLLPAEVTSSNLDKYCMFAYHNLIVIDNEESDSLDCDEATELRLI